MRLLPVLFVVASIVAVSTFAADAGSDAVGLDDLAVLSEGVVVARVGMITPHPIGTGSVALWVTRVMKGTLRSGQDIIWVPRIELPGPKLDSNVLVFLSQMPDGSWHVQTGGNPANIIELKTVHDPILAQVSKYIGAYGPPPAPEPPSPGDLAEWVRDSLRHGDDSRQAAMEKLVNGGEAARVELASDLLSSDRDTVALARTLLPLLSGGPVVNQLRIAIEPEAVEAKVGAKTNITVRFANLSVREMRVVTGSLEFGDNVLASAAYEIFPASGGAPLATVLPVTYGVPANDEPLLPLMRTIPRFGTVPVTVQIWASHEKTDGADVIRLNFPHGYVDLPFAGKYTMRVRYACPGPRPEQQDLFKQNFWKGGQIVSNTVLLTVSE